MKRIFGFIIICSCAINSFAQKEFNEGRWQEIISERRPADIRISSQLWQLAKLAELDKKEADTRLQFADLRYNKSNYRVNIEIVYKNDENLERITDRISDVYLQSLGIEVDQVWKNRASVWMPLEDILKKSAMLGTDYFLFLVTTPRNDDQGPGVMNSSGYKTGSAPGGSGKRVAIFDWGFRSLQTIIDAGNAKTPAYVGLGGTASSIAGVNFTDAEHGTGCVEMVYDNAPDATYEIYGNANTTEKGAAVDDCIAHGVDVISMSQSEYNLGWFDNTGAACAYAQDAVNAGIIFLTSCGNRAESHYEGTFSDADADGRHAFDFPGVDESNNIISSISNNGSTHCYLSWNSGAGTDFDIYICRTSDNAVLASATSTGTGTADFEFVQWTNTTGSSVSVYFRVVRVSGPATVFEMFTHSAGDYQHATAAGSNTSPSNNTSFNVISVGAVPYTDWGDPSGTSNIATSYSSRGPTNGGSTAPNLCGPTNTYADIYNGGFTGTSCSTPNLAGAITSFWSANSYLDATGVTQICLRFAALYRDWGSTGTDNTYGSGGLFLYDWASNLRYMYRTGTNAAITNATRPYYRMEVAQDNAPNGASVIILNNGNYSETGLFGVAGSGSGKRIIYRAPFATESGNFGF
ncbi:MAG: hypothetical protein V4722_07455 [Bacteroidota bacterium]